jgi:hypothetical protein
MADTWRGIEANVSSRHDVILRAADAHLTVLISGEEEERGEADLLEVEADKYVVDRLWEEEAAGLGPGRLIDDPDEEVLVAKVEQDKGDAGEAVDDGRNDRVGDGWQRGGDASGCAAGATRANKARALMTASSVVSGKTVPHWSERMPNLMRWTARGELPRTKSLM